MLQMIGAPNESGRHPPSPSLLSAEDIAWFARRYAAFVVLSAGVAVLAGLIYVLLQQPVFTAATQLLIDPKPTFLLREQMSEGNAILDTPQIESQIAVVKSERVLGKVAEKHEVALTRLTSSGSAGLLSRLRSKSPTPASKEEVRKGHVAQLQGNLEVKRIGLSHVLEISFRAPDRAHAALMANAVAEAFVRDQFDVRTEAARKGGEWLEERIDELRQQMNAAALAVQEFKARRDYRIAGRQTDAAATATAEAAKEGSGIKAPPKVEITSLEELETRAYSYRKIYESYLQAYAETLQRQSYPIAGGRIIAIASAPARKSHPRAVLTLVLAGGLGAMAGLGLAVVVHVLAGGVRSGRQLARLTGIECLSDIRYGGEAEPARALLWWVPHRVWARIKGAHLAQPPRPGLSGGLGLSNRLREFKSIGFASTLKGEGRTTLALEAARRLHATGRKTLLVDADIADPGLSRRYGASGEPGLTDVLAGSPVTAVALWHTEPGGPALLPIGTTIGLATLDAGSADGVVERMLDELCQSFDHVVFDLPTCGGDPDGTILASHLAGCVVIVAAGSTSTDRLTLAIAGLGAAKLRIVGTVLNHPSPG